MWHLEVRWLICQVKLQLLGCKLTCSRLQPHVPTCPKLQPYVLQSGVFYCTEDTVPSVLQGHRVEELIKHCARRAKQAGLLMLQIPTGRRPRPFSPPVLVPLPEALRGRAVLALREDLGFVCESDAHGE